MQNFNTKQILILFIILFFSNNLFPQVTIGSSEPPAQGALLQLKNIDGVIDGGANADKGLAMPRVALRDPVSLYPLSEDNDTDTNIYIGAFIYNTTQNELLCKGLHVWDSKLWVELTKRNIEYIFDKRISNVDGREESHIYPAQKFGNAGTWTLANMRATMYADGTPIQLHTGSTVNIGDALYYYPSIKDGPISPIEDKENYFNGETFVFGLMYTWSAASRKPKIPNVNQGEGMPTGNIDDAIVNPNPSDIEQIGEQGICPDGWHLPSDKEMNDLEKEIANDQNGIYYDNITDPTYNLIPWNEAWRISQLSHRGTHGRALMSPYLNTSLGLSRDFCSSTSAGFSAYPVGFVRNNTLTGANQLGDYWTSSRAAILGSYFDSYLNRAWYRSFINATAGIGVTRRSQTTDLFMSVRCKKN